MRDLSIEILLVTGARLLADTPGAEAWCKAILGEELRELSLRSVVVSGGARGPDRWAREVLMRLLPERPDLRMVEYLPDGIRHYWGRSAVDGQLVHTVRRWCPTYALHPVPQRRPLERDRIMVERATDTLGTGWASFGSCLAFYHPESDTRGTATTVRYWTRLTDYCRLREETWTPTTEIERWQART